MSRFSRRRTDDHGLPSHMDRWVVSYADMITLLLGVFVVLYALGEIKTRKLEELKRSLAFAFHFEGQGKTYQEGLYERGDVGGDLFESAMLLNPQKAPMREFLLQTLPREFEEITGRSLDLELQDDSIRFSGPVSAFFPPGSHRLRADVQPWLTSLVENAHGVASAVRVHVEAPLLQVGTREDGSPYTAQALCLERLGHVQNMIALMRGVMHGHVTVQFDYSEGVAPEADWEEHAMLSVFFSNP